MLNTCHIKRLGASHVTSTFINHLRQKTANSCGAESRQKPYHASIQRGMPPSPGFQPTFGLRRYTSHRSKLLIICWQVFQLFQNKLWHTQRDAHIVPRSFEVLEPPSTLVPFYCERCLHLLLMWSLEGVSDCCVCVLIYGPSIAARQCYTCVVLLLSWRWHSSEGERSRWLYCCGSLSSLTVHRHLSNPELRGHNKSRGCSYYLPELISLTAMIVISNRTTCRILRLNVFVTLGPLSIHGRNAQWQP